MDLLKTLKKTFVFQEACLEDLQRSKKPLENFIHSFCFSELWLMEDKNIK